jgi:hypothetical protein
MRNNEFAQALVFLAWAPRIWPVLLSCAFLIGARIPGRRIAFVVLGVLICWGSLWLTQNFTENWTYSVTKSLSADEQTAVVWVKAGLAAQSISFIIAVPLLLWLRREFTVPRRAGAPQGG